jgi:biopolymer transport protein ExbD
MRVSVKKKPLATTALISMTDVVFLLLIFLLITSNYVTYTGIKIDIPTSENAHADSQNNVVVVINEHNRIWVNDIEIVEANLLAVLTDHVERNPEIVVMIHADQNIPLQRVIDVIDTAKSAGTNRFFIAARLIR